MKTTFVKHLRWLWNNLEAILVFLFFATFSFNLRKVFLTPHSYLNGEFNEYMTMSLNWSDILIFALIIIFITKSLLCQYNIKQHLSSIFFSNRNVSHQTTEKYSPSKNVSYLFVLLIFWMILSLFWTSFRVIAEYRLFIILLLIIFAVIFRFLAKNSFIKEELAYIGLITGGIIQSLTGISQFLLNRSLGLKFLGESILGHDLPGVAKIVASGVKHIRAYGTFPHPNILAGFLIIPIVLLVSILAVRIHREQKTDQRVSRGTILSLIPLWVFVSILFLNLTCFLLTFSRSAFLSLILVGIVILFVNMASVRSKMWLISAIAFFGLLFLASFHISVRETNFLLSNQSLSERVRYANVSREIISEHTLTGVGVGQFVYQEYVSHPNWLGWQYQPVHNIYLLIASELGIVGFSLFTLLLLTLLFNYCIKRNNSVLLTYSLFCVIIMSFLFISFFDHYFWDVKQGIIIFSLPFILSFVNPTFLKK